MKSKISNANAREGGQSSYLFVLDDNLEILNQYRLPANAAEFDELAVNQVNIVCLSSTSSEILILDRYLQDTSEQFDAVSSWLDPGIQRNMKQVRLDEMNNLFIHYKAEKRNFMVVGSLSEFELDFLRRPDLEQFEIFNESFLLFYQKFKRMFYFYEWRARRLHREKEISLTDYLDLVSAGNAYFLLHDKENKMIYKI